MKSKSVLFKFIIFLLYLNFLVIEISLPYFGIEKGINISFLIFIFATKYSAISSIINAFIYGFIYDSAFSYVPFGLFSLLSLVYFVVINYFKNKSAIELVTFFIYLFNYCLTSLFFVGFSFLGLLYSLLSYFVVRVLFILFFKL